MGTKTALLVYADGDVPAALARILDAPPSVIATTTLVERAFPDFEVSALPGGGTLFEGTYPPDRTVLAGVFPGVTVLAARQLVAGPPSSLPQHLIDLAGGRRIVPHSMHSVSDFLAFGLWEQGRLTRSFSVAPRGVGEDVGEPLPFETPFRRGDHPVGGSDPLPYHPLDLGEEACRALLGFAQEGRPSPTDVDTDRIRLLSFRLRGGPQEYLDREAAMAATVAAMVARGPARQERFP